MIFTALALTFGESAISYFHTLRVSRDRSRLLFSRQDFICAMNFLSVRRQKHVKSSYILHRQIFFSPAVGEPLRNVASLILMRITGYRTEVVVALWKFTYRTGIKRSLVPLSAHFARAVNSAMALFARVLAIFRRTATMRATMRQTRAWCNPTCGIAIALLLEHLAWPLC